MRGSGGLCLGDMRAGAAVGPGHGGETTSKDRGPHLAYVSRISADGYALVAQAVPEDSPLGRAMLCGMTIWDAEAG